MRGLELALRHHNLSPAEAVKLSSDVAKEHVLDIAEAYAKRGKQSMGRKVAIAFRSFLSFHGVEIKLGRLEKRKIYAAGRKKISQEIIPSKDQMYRMVDVAASLRNRAMILCLYQSGVRVSCLCRWTHGMFKDQLYPEVNVPVRIVVTSDLDLKLRSYRLEYYVTFLHRDAAQALRDYVEFRKRKGWRPKDSDSIFVTEGTASRGESLTQQNVWEVVKNTAEAAGLNKRGIWVHSIRKSFRKILNASDIDEDTKEAIMGHKLPGSRGNYFDGHDVNEIAAKYMRCHFDRTSEKTSEEAAKKAVLAVMRAQYGDRIPSERWAQIERLLPSVVSVDEMVRTIRNEIEEKAPRRAKTAHNGGSLFETRIVSEAELVRYLDDGWDLIKELQNGKIVIRRSFAGD